jgi:outer membrane receptor for ferrienterochelin and colicins
VVLLRRYKSKKNIKLYLLGLSNFVRFAPLNLNLNMQFKISTALISFALGLYVQFSHAQTAIITGQIVDDISPLLGVNIVIPQLNILTKTDRAGNYTIRDLKEGKYTLKISFIGFKTIEETIEVKEGETIVRNYTLQEDLLNLSEVVVSGTRNQIERYNSPVIINTISNRTFEASQSLVIAEGLNFSPGLRIENNCQNCGFTQLRMNGLDGAYSQILINSRPVFSALAGVYGLEMLPANMVDRIEVVRGGGSVLFGGNAIAGTVNIITKDPIQNSFEAGINQSFTNLETPDRTITFNGAIVSDQLDKGITFFGYNRDRAPWDANGDGFSEIVKLKSNTFGFDAFWNTSERGKLKLGVYNINEFRRGGNNFDLAPHQTDLTEQLQHNIISSNISFEQYSKNFKHKFTAYGSIQSVNRASYYGAGGRIIEEGDTLTQDDILAINAYGNSKDLSLVGGLQYNFEISKKLMLISGTEYVYNDVLDEMPGYSRFIDQQVGTLGTYAQLEIKPTEKLIFLLGGRFDHVNINGVYDLSDERFEDKKILNVPVPRLSAMYKIKSNLKVRASFAQGYRGPQAFDEDLHIETVGGSARFIRLDPNLITERSNSALLSFNYDKMIGKNQMNFVVEGFYTQLNNPFILSDQTELPSGIAVITKRNGEGAVVQGVNLEANVAFGSKLIFQSGFTLQSALYDEEEEIWADENEIVPPTLTKRILRTPNAYGYFTLVYNPTKTLSLSYSGIVTGPMDVPHVIDPDTELTVIKTTPSFFENNIKIAYTIKAKDSYSVQLFGGVQNIFNSFQSDFDLGAQRDASYVYGPLRPRTIFMGLRIGLN